MHTEILSIGDELLTGTLVDTNSAYIATQCEHIGLEVVRHNCVGDKLENLVAVIKEIGNRADVAIVTGGLGPTLDDLTREAAAQAKGVELVFSSEALVDVKKFFDRLGRNVPEANERQTFFPQGSQYIPNPVGTAPGFNCLIGKTEFFFTPGVPKEMRRMLNEQIIPKIQQKFNLQSQMTLVTKTIATFGLSEAVIGKYLESLAKSFPQIKFGTRASFPETQIKLYARNGNAKSLLIDAINKINEQFKMWIFSIDGERMEKVVGDLLRQEKSSVAFVENCCGGIIADWFANVGDSSDFLSMVSVVNFAKTTSLLLGTPILSMQETTKQTAKKIKDLLNVTYTIAIGGITDKKEIPPSNALPGTIYIAISDKNSVDCYSCYLPYEGTYQKKISAMLALDLLRRKILKIPYLAEILGSALIAL